MMGNEHLLSALHDLHKQATVERSHHYTGSLIKEAIDALENYQRNLRSRDDFIVSQGLWSAYTKTLGN